MDESHCLPGCVRPEDIATAAEFLASDQSVVTTAQDLIFDGGWT